MIHTHRALIIFPTYNEKDNIEKIVHAVLPMDPRIHVLIVDDNLTSLEMITQIMMGFRVLQLKACRSAEEARALVAVERFDLILVDFEMPGEDGLALLLGEARIGAGLQEHEDVLAFGRS